MKKSIFVLALIAVSLVSCTKNDDDVVPTKAVETTSVDFGLTSATQGGSTTGKNVTINRGDIPLYVDNITIKAVSSTLNPFIAEDTFSFSPSVDATLPTGLSLSNVALGTNTFSATSTSSNDKKICHLTVYGESWDVIKAKTPYIPCVSETKTALIKKKDNAKIDLNMTTNHGRILAKFVQESPDASRYWVLLQVNAGGSPITGAGGIISLPSGSIMPQDWEWPASFQWSNEFAIDNATATFTFTIFERPASGTFTSVAALGQPLNVTTQTVAIEKGKSKLCTFRIYNTDVHTDITEGGIELHFPTIDEVTVGN